MLVLVISIVTTIARVSRQLRDRCIIFLIASFLLLKNCRYRNIMHKRKKIYPLIPVDNTDLNK